jgi:two-component system phosphate regulon sensor histidine kinase PhoR
LSAGFGIAGAIVLLVLGLLVFFEVWRPLAQIRKSLAQFARRDFSSGPLPSTPGLFYGSLRDIRNIAEMLQTFDRQIVDEGFSLRAILSSMVEGVLIADRSLRIRLANEALINLLGLPESPLNRPVIEVFRRHELQRALETALDEGAPQQISLTLEIPSPGGGYRTSHLNVHIAGLMPQPQARPTAALVVFHDVTAIRELEAARREFLGNVSHEFRTPLAIINGYLETLLDGALEDREMAEKSLRAMHKNGRRLALLIDDLLTISRLEDRSRLLEFLPVDLQELLGHVIEHLEPNIAEKKARIEISWPADARPAEADGRRMEQVFSNLLGNALRYGDVENPVIRISARRAGPDICIVFADNGPGIPLGDQPHIFERFYRVHKDRSRDAGGTGLGLAIVKGVVLAHGGNLSLESTPGKGAAFTVTIPASQTAPG